MACTKDCGFLLLDKLFVLPSNTSFENLEKLLSLIKGQINPGEVLGFYETIIPPGIIIKYQPNGKIAIVRENGIEEIPYVNGFFYRNACQAQQSFVKELQNHKGRYIVVRKDSLCQFVPDVPYSLKTIVKL